jgi:hypothetical protein
LARALSLGAWALALLAGVAVAAPAVAQGVPVRFEVVSASDSTITFRVVHEPWIRAGAEGTVVDPQRRDALVASIRVMRVAPDEITALVTGQTTRVAPGHVAILRRPPAPWYARGSFWGGVVLGAVLGAIVAH